MLTWAGRRFRPTPFFAGYNSRVRFLPQRFLASVLFRLRVLTCLKAYPRGATEEGSAIPLGDTSMKNLVSLIVALALAVGFAAPTFAADAPKTKSACEKAHMKWDASTKTCS